MDHNIISQSPLEASRNANDIKGLDTLRRAAQSGDKAALEEAAKQFEAIFVQMMLKSMRKAQDVLADKDSAFNSDQVKFYRDMHDQQLSTDLSSNGSIGLADIIVRQLGHLGDGYMPAGVIRDDGNLSGINRQSVEQTLSAQSNVLGELPHSDSSSDNAVSYKSTNAFKSPGFTDAQAFVEQLYPIAQQAAEPLGLDPTALLAQAALETGWGKHMIHNIDGENSHNLFGIKASRSWQGDRALVDTVEFDQGIASTKKQPFKVYENFADSMRDYVNLVQQSPRYGEAVKNTESPQSYFSELQKAGYATDPEYANKVISVFESAQFKQYLP